MYKLPFAFGAVLVLLLVGAIDRLGAAAGQLLRSSEAFQNLVREIGAAAR